MGKQTSTEDMLSYALLIIIVVIIIIMVIIFLALALATLIAPIVALILFLINWIRYMVQDRKWRATNFWLSKSEQEEYKKTVYTLAHAEDERRKVQDSVITHGIYRNQDGQISQRSYAGRGLRERENTANSLINEYTPIHNELTFRPYKRWKKAKKHYSRAFGFGLIIFVIAAIFGIMQLGDVSGNEPLISNFQSAVADYTKVVENQVDDSDIFGIYGVSFGFMAGFLVALAIILLIGWLLGLIIFRLKNPKPPMVSMDNVDTHICKFNKKRAKKEIKRQQRQEEIRQRREQKKIAKEKAKEEKNRLAEKKSEETETQNVEGTTSDLPDAGAGIAAHETTENNVRQRSKEENMFISWGDILRNEGYNLVGNWENWENAGLWKNLAVVSSVNGVGIRIIIEYDVQYKKIYFGIAKLNDEEKVSQELLNSETFQNIITENGLTVKNNEWWYCLKFSTFDKVFQEYRHFIKAIS